MNSEMPKGGVKHLLLSTAGRSYLKRLQEKYKYDIVQPKDNPHLFNQLYGSKIKRQQEIKSRQESTAKQQWQENKERATFQARSIDKKKIIMV